MNGGALLGKHFTTKPRASVLHFSPCSEMIDPLSLCDLGLSANDVVHVDVKSLSGATFGHSSSSSASSSSASSSSAAGSSAAGQSSSSSHGAGAAGGGAAGESASGEGKNDEPDEYDDDFE